MEDTSEKITTYESVDEDGEHSMHTDEQSSKMNGDIVGMVRLKSSDETTYKGDPIENPCKVGDIEAVNGAKQTWYEVLEKGVNFKD